MRRYLTTLFLLGFLFLIYSLYSVVVAQVEEEMEYSWGVVSSVTSEQIVVTEYDYDKDKEVSVTYTIDPKAKFRGIDSLKDIKVGDSVEIDYVVTDGKKVVRVIGVERLSEEEGGEEPQSLPPQEEPFFH